MAFKNAIQVKFSNLFARLLYCIFLLFFTSFLFAQKAIVLSKQKFPLSIGTSISILVDNDTLYNTANITSQSGFQLNNTPVPVFGNSKNNIWAKFIIRNVSNKDQLYLSINYADISEIKLYEKDSANGLALVKKIGNTISFYDRDDDNVYYNFYLNLPVHSEKTFYLNVSSPHPFELPVFINNFSALSSSSFKENLIVGLYCGLILSTVFYNLFLFASTKDKNYLLYIIYLVILCFAQITFEGWSFKIFWPSLPQLNAYSICISCAGGIMGILFAKHFLNTAYYTPRLNKLLTFFIFCYSFSIILNFSPYAWVSYVAFNYTGIAASVLVFYLSVIIYKKGFASARFYIIAWSAFLLGFIIYLLKNLNVVPYNGFTHFVLYIGSSIEAILLSLALANKINILSKEKEAMQAESLRISKENEQLIQQQNVVLEQKINERTQALEHTLSNLKNAQMQLVESEKMASLGQLTAGIAHEINNPINFVKSNVKPLQLDVNDLFELIRRYQKLHGAPGCSELVMLNEIKLFEEEIDPGFIKDEIESLIDGIEEGAERTAEIVKSLRNFSRLDESEIKMANVHEGLNSTLVLLKNIIPPNIKIIKRFAAEGDVECYPSKLNQAFMNIITNAIQAIKAKPYEDGESIVIATRDTEDFLQISIKDTGAGMTKEVKHKMFDPFFTTKEVGEGTGLGMSITFKIIEKHQGKISVDSSPGNGSEILLSIPYAQIPDPIIINNEYE